MSLDNRLWVMAVQTASEAGLEFTVPCSHNLRDLIRAGVSTMQREGKLEEANGESAGASLETLVREMIRATLELGAKPEAGKKGQIREGALVQAKKLCPLWPFG